MNNVTKLPDQLPKVHQCGCGSQAFHLCEDGRVVCLQCRYIIAPLRVESADRPSSATAAQGAEREPITREQFKHLRGEARELAIHRNDCLVFSDFYHKHVIGSKVEPSCFGCGQQRYSERGIAHSELPDIYLCKICHEKIQASEHMGQPPIPEGWQPIETLICDDREVLMWYERGGHYDIQDADHDSNPKWWRDRGWTHWAPLPLAPLAAAPI